MSELLKMVIADTQRDLEKVHDTIAKLNDDLRYVRGVDFETLEEKDIALLKKVAESLQGVAIVQVLLEIMLVKRLKGQTDESL